MDVREKCQCNLRQLAGELQYLSERFWGGCSGVVEKCVKLDGDCGWNSFSVRWMWNFSVSLEEIEKTMLHLKN